MNNSSTTHPTRAAAPRPRFAWTAAGLFAVLGGLAVFFWFPKTAPGLWALALLTFLVTSALLAALGSRFVPAAAGMLSSYPLRWRILWAAGWLMAGIWLSMNIPLAVPPAAWNGFAPPLLLKLAYRAATGVLIGMAGLALSTWAASARSQPAPGAARRRPGVGALGYAMPLMLVWGVYLLAYYPGMMSADSLVQWEQVLSGSFNDHHPAVHTFLIWLLTRIALTPAVVATAQIAALALVAGGWFALMEGMGVRRSAVVLSAAVFALTPVNGTMVNTLWKDIPFSTAVLGLTLIFAQIVVTRGAWAAAHRAKIVLGVTLALVMLLRHDGLALGAASFAALAVLYPRRWKSWLAAGFLSALLYLGVRGPVYAWVGVGATDAHAEASFSLYQIAAYAQPGSSADRLIQSMGPFSAARTCEIWDNLAPCWRTADLDPTLPLPQAAWNLARRAPNVLLYSYQCNRSMEWVVWDPHGEVRNASHVELLIDPNPFGLRHDSRLPALRDLVSQWVIRTSYDPSLSWLFWRPALYLYLALFVTAVMVWKNRDPRWILLAAPILIQSITFTLIPAAPNFRYHYAVYLVALSMLPLLAAPALPAASEQPGADAAQPALSDSKMPYDQPAKS